MMRFWRSQLVDSVVQATRVGRPGWQRYGLAAALALLGFGLAWWLRPTVGDAGLILLFYPAVLLAAWFGGLGPGLLATAFMAAPGALEPRLGAWPAGFLLTFLLTGAATSVLCEVVHEARRQRQESLRRAERMASVQPELDDALADASRVPQVAEIVVGQGCALLGASAGTLAVRDAARPILRTVHAVGYPPDVDADRVIPLDSDEPLAEAVRRRAVVVVESRRASDARYPHLARVRDLTGTEAVVTLPLAVQGRVLGGIGFSFKEPRRFRRTDVPLMQVLARQGALALEGAGRYEREQAARKRAEAMAERQRFLAGANACLTAPADYTASLREVARLAVPTFAEACLIHLGKPEGGLRLVAAFHADAERAAALEDLGHRQTDTCAGGLWNAFYARRAELLSDARPAWSARAHDDADRELIDRLCLGSSLSAPLVARDRSLGSITFLTSSGGRLLDDDDLTLALELASRAAAAVDSALLYEEARRLNRVKDEFLALLSHELRTPLGSVLVWLELLRSESLEPSAARAAEMILRSAHQLAELIDQLLDVSRIVAGKLSVEKQRADLSAIVGGVLELVGPAANAKGVRLSGKMDRSLDSVWADPNRLRQALTNLVSNAIKFTPEGGVVDVRLERAGRTARIVVRDTGIGIPADLLPFIFESFRQGDTKSTRTHGGLGLGLAIARHIAEQHEGRISAASDGPGRGSVFTLDLPLRPPPGRSPAATTDAEDAAPDHPLTSLRVLVVDDHQDTLHGLTLGLRASGAEVTPASSAREALAELPRVRPHVLVSDLAMPGQDGYALIDEIRRMTPEAGGLVPAVAVSAYASPDDRCRALRAGYHEHIAKPVEIAQLVATVARLAGVE